MYAGRIRRSSERSTASGIAVFVSAMESEGLSFKVTVPAGATIEVLVRQLEIPSKISYRLYREGHEVTATLRTLLHDGDKLLLRKQTPDKPAEVWWIEDDASIHHGNITQNDASEVLEVEEKHLLGTLRLRLMRNQVFPNREQAIREMHKRMNPG